MTYARGMQRFVGVVLVDACGWLIVQERDEHAPIAPERWGLVGGHVEPGESYRSAAYRELAEETGVCLDGGLRLWDEAVLDHSDQHRGEPMQVWVAPTRLTDADIVVGEGRQIVFVDPAHVTDLPLTASAAHFLRRLIGSPEHDRLRREAASAPV